ncbi:hypothetical protein UCREL1_6848 [Eutypa lata UCREL1]|uniref:Uncharacterized protein n=1 Tax=Eutypa lata (strain UCR-EL1) TaxID=1287681 RepID=M7SPL7_EUTLA|nr:hypothetical protein UCREL1_6848 [Eutypa lata UCREL1]
MQGQPGGLNGGPGPVSQSPGMNTLNAPVRRTPVSAGVEGQPPMGQANGPFAQTLDPRFNQGNQRPQMGMNANMDRQQILQQIIAQVPVEKRQQLMSLSPERLNEVIMNWQATQASRTPGQMAGRPQPQPGQMGQGNHLGQFVPGTNAMGHQPNMNPQMNAQNQMLLQQQIQRMRNNVPGQNYPPNAPALMDSMEVPPKILDNLTRQQGQPIPPDVKKWGQLKQWMVPRNIPTQLQGSLLGIQKAQFENILKRNASMNAAAGQMPQPNAPPASQPMNGQMPARPGQMPGGVPPGFPAPVITQQEIQAAKNHDRFRGHSDDKIRAMLFQMKAQMRRTNPQIPGAPMQAPPAAQGPPINMHAPAQPQTAPNPPQRPQNAAPDANAASSAPNARNSRPNQNNRPTQNASPAAPQKNGLKRASTDDVVEVPNPAATQALRPPSQQAHPTVPGPPLPALTPQQLAALPPEQRAKYEAMVRSRQQPQPEDIERLKAIGQEERRAAQQEQVEDIPMSAEQLEEMTQKIRHMSSEVNKLGKVLGRWYSLTHDDARAHMFFKMVSLIEDVSTIEN